MTKLIGARYSHGIRDAVVVDISVRAGGKKVEA